MKVLLDDKTIFLLPTRLIVNRFFAGAFRKRLKKHGVHLSRRQMSALIRAFYKCRRSLPDWDVVEAVQNGGHRIKVKL